MFVDDASESCAVVVTGQEEQGREAAVQSTSSDTNPASPRLRSDDSTSEVNDSSQRPDDSDNSTDRSVSSGDETRSDIEESSYMEDESQDDVVNKTSDSMADANESSLILSVGKPERVIDPTVYRSTVIIDSDESESGEEEEDGASPQESHFTHPDTDCSYVEVVDSSCREEEEEEEEDEVSAGEEEEDEVSGGEKEEDEEEDEEVSGGEKEEEEEEEDGASPQESHLTHPDTDCSYVEVVDSSCREEEEEEEEDEVSGGEKEEEEEEEDEVSGGEKEEEEEVEDEEVSGGEKEEEEEEEDEVSGGEKEEETGEDEGEKGGESPRSVETVYDQSLSSVETSSDNADLHLTTEGSCVSPDSGVSLQEGSEGLSKLPLEKSSVSQHSLGEPSPQKEVEVLDTTSSDEGDSGSSPGADTTHKPGRDETDYHVSSMSTCSSLSKPAKPSPTDASSKGHRREGLDKPEPQFKVGYQYRTLVKQLETMEVSGEEGEGRRGKGGGRWEGGWEGGGGRMKVSREDAA